jgi:hypothetical protein
VTMLQLMMMMMWWGPVYHKTDNSDTVYWETVPQDAFIVLSAYRKDKNVRTKKTDGQHDTQIGLIWAHTSQLSLHGIRHSLQCACVFLQLFCDWGSWIKLSFYSQWYRSSLVPFPHSGTGDNWMSRHRTCLLYSPSPTIQGMATGSLAGWILPFLRPY